jgi:hypothetical protein
MTKLKIAFRNFTNAFQHTKEHTFSKIDFRGSGLLNVAFHSLLNAAASWALLI